MFKFLHAADAHLDSPMVGLERYEGAPVEAIRGATRRAFENLVELAIAETVAFVLLAGDLYDGNWKDYNTGLFFAKQMAELDKHGIRVFVVSGNHDGANQMTRSLRTPDNVYQFATNRAESRVLGDFSVAIHGRGFATKAVSEDLAAGYPQAVKDCFNIGLLHTSLDGREGHAPYAPCSLDVLRSKHYQYWALGHVHAREIVAREPWVVFPGNTQGRHVRESGPKGCTVVTVDDLKVADLREARLDVLCWSLCRVDLSGTTTVEEVFARVALELQENVTNADGRMVCARLELYGVTGAHGKLKAHPERWAEELRALVVDRFGDGVWLEKITFRTSAESKDAPEAGALAGLLSNVQDDVALVEVLAKEFTALRGKLPYELVDPDSPDSIDPISPDVMEEAIQQARELLLARLSTEEGAP